MSITLCISQGLKTTHVFAKRCVAIVNARLGRCLHCVVDVIEMAPEQV